MGNKRMIDGDIASSTSLNAVCRDARLTFVHLLTLADSHGRFVYTPRVLLAGCFPVDEEVSESLLGEWLDELIREGCVHRYTVKDHNYGHLPSWEDYQSLRRRGPSKVPDPGNCDGCTTPGVVPDHSSPRREVEVEGKGMEGNSDVPSPSSDLVLLPIPSDDLVPQRSNGVISPERLVDLLAKKPGTKESKLAWLEDNLDLMVCEVAAFPDITTRPQAMAKLRTYIFRWYRWHLKHPEGRPVTESFDERKRREDKQWLADLAN